MRPAELLEMLSKTIEAGLPVMIKGAPGIGKTDIVTQAADAAGCDLIVMHPVVSDPTDFKGLPGIVEGKAEFLPFGDLRELMEAEDPTIAFLDDLGQAPAVVQAAAMQLILARKINGHAISDKVTFIAATNRREDRAGVTGILEPVKSRFASIVELEVSHTEWSVWALDNDVPAEVVAFVRFRPDLFDGQTQVTNDIVNRPSPRTVTNLSKLFKVGIRSLEALAGAAGEGFATEFLGFLQIYQSLPNIDEILVSPKTAPVPKQPAALFAVATAIASRIGRDNADRAMTYLLRLPDEFSVLGVRDSLRRCSEAAKCKEFQQWAVKHQELLS